MLDKEESRLAYEIIALAIREYKDILQGEIYYKEVHARANKFEPPFPEPKSRKESAKNSGARKHWATEESNRISREYANEGYRVPPLLIAKILSHNYFSVLKNGKLSIDGYNIKKLNNFFRSEWCETLLLACSSRLHGDDIIDAITSRCSKRLTFKSEEEKEKFIKRLDFAKSLRDKRRKGEASEPERGVESA